MKLRGGYKILPTGRPNESIRTMPTPSELYIPLKSKRFDFSEAAVRSGDKVAIGDVLARDPDNFALPLLAPASGTVQLDLESNCVTISSISDLGPYPSTCDLSIHKDGSAADKIKKLVSLGAWEFLYEAFTGALPDPNGTPQAIIVSTIALDPFVARGDVQLKDQLVHFTRGLEHLQSLLEYQQIYLVLPKVKSDFAGQVRKLIRGHAWVNIVEVDLKYPFDNFNILARGLGLKSSVGPIWALRTEGVHAIDDALTDSRPCIERVISVAGSDIVDPTHVSVTAGYPVETLVSEFKVPFASRVINGGIMTGSAIQHGRSGIDTECRGITFLPEHTEREFIGWMRPGFDRRCYGSCFGSALMGDFRERLTTAVRGEVRPCISCNFCEEVCPAGIMPHLIHKYLYKDLIEEADSAHVSFCVQCGLCSFVCTSKLELREEFAKAIEVIEEEKAVARAAAAKQEAESENKQE